MPALRRVAMEVTSDTQTAELPDGWRVVRLEEIAKERKDRADSAPHADVFSVTKHNGFVRSLEYFERQVFSRDTSNYKVVSRGDLAYATIHLDEGSLGILRDAEAALISPMYTVFAVDRSQVEPDYLFSLMKLPQMVARYGRIGEGTVHRRKSISFERLGRLSFAIPPVEEQRRAMVMLDAIDEAIERTESVISTTERLRDAVLNELLTRGVPGWHARSKQVPGLGTVPVDWHIARVCDVFDILDRRRAPLNADERAKMPGDYPYYGANGVVDYIDGWIFDEPDDLVLLAEDGGHFDDFRTRPIAYRVRGKCWVNNHAHILRAKDPNASSFLFHSMVNKDLRPFINGTTRSKLTQADLRRVLIGIPSTSAEMSYIGKCLDTIEVLLQLSRSQQRSMEQLRMAVSTVLLNGLVDVFKQEDSSHANA